MFDEISLILYPLVRLVYKKKTVDNAINLRKVMNKEFLTNQSNQLKNTLLTLGLPRVMPFKSSTLLPKKKIFRKGCKQFVVEILLKLLGHLPTNQMVFVNAPSLNPVNMARIPSNAQKNSRKWVITSFF